MYCRNLKQMYIDRGANLVDAQAIKNTKDFIPFVEDVCHDARQFESFKNFTLAIDPENDDLYFLVVRWINSDFLVFL